MKKILQVCAFGAPNAGNFIASLLALQEEMYKKGYETIYVFACTAKGKEWCEKIAKTNKVYYLPVAKARILPQTYKILKKIYEDNNVDIAHSHFELYDLPTVMMAPTKTKVFLHLHDALKENYKKDSVSRKLLTKAQYSFVGRRARLLSVSKEHAEFVHSLGFPKGNIYYVPNGIDCSRIKKVNLLTAQDYLMFGWEVRRKGVDVATEAMRQIREQGIDNIHLNIVGQDACEEYLETINEENITFLRPVNDINSLYLNTKVFLHISRAEGLSYALLEVIYAGIPVICSNIAENLFATSFRNVMIVPVDNSIETAKAMLEYANKEIIDEDVLYNRTLIENEYSIENWCKVISGFYFEDESIISRSKLYV